MYFEPFNHLSNTSSGKQALVGDHAGKYLERAANIWKITKGPDLKKQDGAYGNYFNKYSTTRRISRHLFTGQVLNRMGRLGT